MFTSPNEIDPFHSDLAIILNSYFLLLNSFSASTQSSKCWPCLPPRSRYRSYARLRMSSTVGSAGAAAARTRLALGAAGAEVSVVFDRDVGRFAMSVVSDLKNTTSWTG